MIDVIRKVTRRREYALIELPIDWVRTNDFPQYVRISDSAEKLIVEALK